MASRRNGWLIATLAGLAVAGGLVRDPSTRDLSVPAALLAVACVGLIVEVILAMRAPGEAEAFPPLIDDRPADGVVEVAEVAGVEGDSNRFDRTYRRFVRLAEDASTSIEAGSRPTGHRPLLGRVVLFSIFIGRHGRSWTDQEIARGHEALRRGAGWIEQEAARRAVPVNLALAEAYFRVEDVSDPLVEVGFVPEGGDVAPMEAGASDRYLIDASRAASRLGFADVGALMRSLDARVRADATAWILHQKSAGRSLAIPASESSVAGVGLAVCFAREANFPEPLAGPARVSPTTVVHEVLHLFGASDKYGRAREGYPPGQVSSRDIMRLDQGSLGRMRVDPLTAAELGWIARPIVDSKKEKGAPPRGSGTRRPGVDRSDDQSGVGSEVNGRPPRAGPGVSWIRPADRSWPGYSPGSPRRRRGERRHTWPWGRSASRRHRRRSPYEDHATRSSRLAGTIQT